MDGANHESPEVVIVGDVNESQANKSIILNEKKLILGKEMNEFLASANHPNSVTRYRTSATASRAFSPGLISPGVKSPGSFLSFEK